jgi:hypothetical protein
MPSTTDQFEVNNVWASAAAQDVSESLTLPSGQTCRAKRLGMEGILAAGILGDADTLTAFVDRKHVRKVRGGKGADTEEIDMKSILKDPTALPKMVMLCDRAVPLIVEIPQVLLHFKDNADGTTTKIPVDERESGAIYTDMITLEDKIFLFSFAVGGTRDIESFREQSARAVAGVADGESVSVPTERPAGNKKRSSRK